MVDANKLSTSNLIVVVVADSYRLRGTLAFKPMTKSSYVQARVMFTLSRNLCPVKRKR